MSTTIPDETTAVETEQLAGPDAVAPAAGFIATIRKHGVFTQLFNVAGVNKGSAVCVSLSEITASTPGGALDTPFLGDAAMKVYNVVPLDGGQVRLRGEVAWGVDLNVRVMFIVS
ncbi:hypothetical protein GCM10010472_71640 [Pseudonocardia halophobica]|uniref:Uncharacterized protein n=2 Tax=Pseudonocardia halophobica TaxID=29401 RepID=A0A9W6NVL2_9PSEU|nr:hypothetical protein GCM10017577_21050 [Pseudonocardia halophobica]